MLYPLNLYLYNTNYVCVSVKYRRPNGWTDHDQIWHVYADRPRNGSYQKKNGPTYGPEGWAHWGHSSKRVLSWRAASNPSSDSEPLAKQTQIAQCAAVNQLGRCVEN